MTKASAVTRQTLAYVQRIDYTATSEQNKASPFINRFSSISDDSSCTPSRCCNVIDTAHKRAFERSVSGPSFVMIVAELSFVTSGPSSCHAVQRCMLTIKTFSTAGTCHVVLRQTSTGTCPSPGR